MLASDNIAVADDVSGKATRISILATYSSDL
jgi:hypothetical protein